MYISDWLSLIGLEMGISLSLVSPTTLMNTLQPYLLIQCVEINFSPLFHVFTHSLLIYLLFYFIIDTKIFNIQYNENKQLIPELMSMAINAHISSKTLKLNYCSVM